ncbi:MAG TPA: redoxin domain-containing protein [Anaerolineales bacterium]|nr:redoxin domain-containing protein [Anaerolineales bacterium]
MVQMVEYESKLQTGQPAPDFSLPDITGIQHSLGEFHGRVVILNFWSAECTWAQRTDAALQQLLQAWRERVVLISVASNTNEDPGLIRQTAGDRGLPYLLVDEGSRLADLYGAQTTPHLFLIDPQGILRYQGAFDDVTFRQRTPTKDYLRQAVEAVLAGQHPDPDQTPAYGCMIVRPA